MAPSAKAQPKPARSAPSNSKNIHSSPSASAHPGTAPNNRQHVVPAIPLSLMPRHPNGNNKAEAKPIPADAHVLAAPPSSNAHPAAPLDAAIANHGPSPSPRASESGSQQHNANIDGHLADFPVRHDQKSEPAELQASGISHAGTETPARVEPTSGTDVNFYASQPQSATSTTNPEFASFPPPPQLVQHQQHTGAYRHPPGFHAPHPHHVHANHQHRHQMSNGGGVVFGVLDSHTPSPAPPPGVFLPPPPPVDGSNRGHPGLGGHHHNHSNGNGFPGLINTHFPGDRVPLSTMDGYGTVPDPVNAFPQGHFETLPPNASRHGPPTPHSFHGSHASGDHNGIDNPSFPYPPSGSYAHHPRLDHPAAHPHHPGPFPPFIPPQAVSQQFNVTDHGFMEGVDYIRNSFDNGELSDCTLELRSTKGRHHPIKISGHKLILARSPSLKRAILAARSTERGPATISLEIDDPHLRSDAWWMAIQRLYLHPLIQPPPMLGNAPNGIDFAGDKADRFDFCLGYAAAGHVLLMQDIVFRGLYIAAHSVTWETVEAGLGFVLERSVQRHLDRGTGTDEEASVSAFLDFGYGAETRILLDAILDFLVKEFPSNFELDTSVLDNPKTARIPANAGNPTAHTPAFGQAGPILARGTTGRQILKQSRVASIKFGDLPAAYPGEAASAQQQPAKYSTTLSRILLNLPYDQLCQVLTSGGQGVPEWNTAQDRHRAVIDIVAEREARRLRGVEAVRSEAVPYARDIQLRLSAPQRYPVADMWDVLNWEERVEGGETPRITRRWVPQFSVVERQPSEQQTLPSYNIPNSMV
ncbi:hypothetical protein F5Y17DRAFT_233960 [Xylariaceae sp. FL0594]|nr:hypothetical protein F5Y17DRAFT_233960 [Xylariaceae sp. FL0594]